MIKTFYFKLCACFLFLAIIGAIIRVVLFDLTYFDWWVISPVLFVFGPPIVVFVLIIMIWYVLDDV